MYTPAHFDMRDPDAIRFIQENSFGILFSPVAGRPFATHLPMIINQGDGEKGQLLCHFARANPQWRELDGAEVLVVFQGPHAFISPSWYVERQAVPTWNYLAVHVYGTCRVMRDDAELHALLARTVRTYEPESPLLEQLHEEIYVKMAKAVVGVAIEITAIEGKAKLSQNRSPESIRGVIDGLRSSGDGGAGEVATLMERDLE
jgi:transcriptional regulator